MLTKFIGLVKPGSENSGHSGKRESRIRNFYYLVRQYQYDIFLGCCFALVAIISFNVGKIGLFGPSALKVGAGANIYQAAQSNSDKPLPAATVKKPTDSRVVASKSTSSKLYHFTWCSGAKRIKEENKVWFNNEAEAIAAGYSLAANCQ